MRAILLTLLLAAVAHAAAPPWPAKSRRPVGRSVTFVDGPLDKDGYIDFPAALNARYSRGVTPKNNAAVLIWRAIGPRPEGGKAMPAEYFALMGITAPPEKGDYFIGRERFAKEHLKLDDDGIDQFQSDQTPFRRIWSAKEKPHLAGWLKANDKPLAVVVAATKRTRYFVPLLPQMDGGKSSGLLSALLPSVQKTRELAAALTARALRKAGQGDAAGAWADLLACHRLARLAGEGGTLIELLVGLALDRMACDADLAFLEHTRPDAKTLAGYARDLHALPPMARVADKVELAERLVFLDMTQLMDRHGPGHLEAMGGGGGPKATPLGRLFEARVDYTPAMRAGNEWYDRMVAAMRAGTRRQRKESLWELERQVRMLRASTQDTRALLASWFGGPEARGREIGKVLIGLLLPATAKVQDAEDRVGQIRDNLLIALALEHYQRDHDKYPKELSALSPKYLKGVPTDIFSAGPLVYRPDGKGYLLYSVGPDGKDDGGRGEADDPRGDDLPVRMPRPKPKD